MKRRNVTDHRRIVVKVGSALLVDRATGQLNREWLATLADDIATLAAKGREVLVVSSGAIALGRQRLQRSRGPLKLEEAQATAAIGQIALAGAWAHALEKRGLAAAQILLTWDDTEQRRRYLNARATLATLIKMRVIPVINENDTVATAEIRYGDNDRLAARVAAMAGADCLVLLSDVDGLYTAPPDRDANARHLPVVEEVTLAIEAMAGGAASHVSRGGMQTKIEAGKIATKAGTAMIIAKGTDNHPLQTLWSGGRHTLFRPVETRAQARKRWIMGSLDVAGSLTIDEGAMRALLAGKSLLPVGVTWVRGEFARGDAVSILDPGGNEIARGLAGLDSVDAQLVKGKNSARVAEVLGEHARSELVHRDNMVVLRGAK